MLKQLSVTSLIISSCALTGCAFVPEDIKLQPKPDYSHSHIGQGKKVALRIMDTRPSSAVGGRASGYGPAAKINLDSTQMVASVRQALSRGLRANDFKVVGGNQPANARLKVRVSAIQYKQRAGFWTGHIDINSSIEGEASKSNNRSYDKIYRYNSTKDVIFTPTEGGDNKNINRAVSQSLSKLLADKKLLRFLAH
jgi:uncharacterized lipoprotein YajG